MRIVKRVVVTAVLLGAALPGSAVAGDGYAGFGDPTAVATTSARGVLAAAPLPGGHALVLAATTGGQHVEAFDTGDPKHAHQLAAGWGGTVVTWPDGRRLAVVTAADGIQTVAAGPDGAWGAPVALGNLRAGVSQVRAVALADGRAAIAFTTGTQGAPTSHLFAVATDAAGTPAAAPVDYGAVSGFRLAAAPDGTAAVAFQRAPAPGAPATTASVATLPHGAAAFGAPVSVPGSGPAGVPPIAVAADGSAVLVAVSDTRIARVAPDGSALPDLPPLAGTEHHPGPVALDVAADGTVVLDAANPLDGWTLGGLRPDGTTLPVVSGPAGSPELEGDVGVHAWPGGASIALVRGWVGDSSSPYLGVVVRDASGATAGTVLATGPELAGFPGTAAGAFDAYTISGGTLWRIARPGTPSRHAATLTTYPGQIRATQRVVGFHVSANQAGTATVTARIRRGAHGAWHTVKPTNGTATLVPFTDAYMTFPLSGSGSVCTGDVAWTVVATARFTNRVGVRASSTTTYRRSCQRRHAPAR
ncbi:hypothetical protein [Conexibacter woesei]|uniref:hypothetical protein n=1 Tax=Conexibacter woesei TaxID=191495 RepID=UPI0003F54600|nr:hypothetical protein [Conexibacter woesei]